MNGKNNLTVLGNGKMQMEFTLKVHGNSLMKSGIILDQWDYVNWLAKRLEGNSTISANQMEI